MLICGNYSKIHSKNHGETTKYLGLCYEFSNKTSGSPITTFSYVSVCFNFALLHLYCCERFVFVSPFAVLRVTVAHGINA